MRNNAESIVVIFDYLKILLKDEDKECLDFFDFLKNNLKNKVEKSAENCLSFLDNLKDAFSKKADEEEGDEEFTDLIIKKCKQNKEIRQEVRKSILEALLKNGEDDENDDIYIYKLIELFVEKNKSKKEPDE